MRTMNAAAEDAEDALLAPAGHLPAGGADRAAVGGDRGAGRRDTGAHIVEPQRVVWYREPENSGGVTGWRSCA